MLLEGFVALIALATVMIASDAELAGKGPGAVYGAGLGRFLAVIIGEQHLLFATTFGAMAFSTFVFDTLDVSTRLGRYILQELIGLVGPRGRRLRHRRSPSLVPLVFLLAAGEGAYRLFWVLFGTSNQLLAALSLLGISVWLRRSGRPSWFAWVPMALVMAVTLTSLAIQVVAAYRLVAESGARLTTPTLNGAVSLLLLVLALVLIAEAARSIRSGAAARASAA